MRAVASGTAAEVCVDFGSRVRGAFGQREREGAWRPEILRDAPFGAGGEKVADANVGKRAADHHAVVAPAAAVAVEVGGLNSVFLQVFAGGAGLADIARGRDVVGRHAVAEDGQHPRACDRLNRAGLDGHIGQKGRLLDVGAAVVPLIEIPLGDLDPVPHVVGGEDVAVSRREHLWQHRAGQCLPHFLVRRPNILQIDLRSTGAGADRLTG